MDVVLISRMCRCFVFHFEEGFSMRDLPLFLMQVGPLSANVLPVPESVRRELMVSVIIFLQSLLRAVADN